MSELVFKLLSWVVLSVLFCLKETNFKDKALQKIHSAYTLHREGKLLQQ